jgi:hypothetical protein
VVDAKKTNSYINIYKMPHKLIGVIDELKLKHNETRKLNE